MRRQQGFSLISALFLIVVLAALGSFAVRSSVAQQHTVSIGLQGNRALQAARAGVEWAAWRALSASTCANGALNLNEAALNGFRVTVTCTPTDHAEGGSTYQVYAVDSFAQYGTYGTPDYVSRRVQASFTNAP